MAKKSNAVVIPVGKHGLSKDKMDQDALKILEKLESAGYQAFLVGGCIRDLIAGKQPKDTDIVTNARPEQIKRVFKRGIIIGRRFPLVHVRIPGKKYKVIEVATFRTKFADYKSGFKLLHWLTKFFVYGNIDQDAERRDLTVQAMYWRLSDAAILDYHSGYEHAKSGQIKVIGLPEQRFAEDPVRILRVLRVMAKLGFNIDKETHSAILASRSLLQNVSAARMFGEVLRSFHGGFGLDFARLMIRYKIHNTIFPGAIISKKTEKWLYVALTEADDRYKQGMSLSAGYLLSVILWPIYFKLNAKNKRFSKKNALKVIMRQHKATVMPKKHIQMIEAIWRLQPMLINNLSVEKASKLMHAQYFKAAYDFLLLRSKFNSDIAAYADKWTDFLALDEESRKQFSFEELVSEHD